jgi:modulator of FtsH protease
MPDGWDSFFVALVGASAALTGLVFVALSINLERIVEYEMLVGRAAEALLLLALPVMLGLAVLVPDVATRTTGALCAIPALIAFATVNRTIAKGRVAARARPPYEFRIRVSIAEVALVPAVVGAGVLLGGSTSGIYWIAFAVAAEIAAGIVDAWVPLIEIRR